MKIDNNRNMSDRVIIRRLINYAKPFFKSFAFAFFMMAIGVACNLLVPLMFGSITAVLGNDPKALETVPGVVFSVAKLFGDSPYALVFSIGSIATVVIVTSLLISYFQSILLQKTGQQIIYNMRKETFEHIEKLSAKQLNDIPVGKLVTRVTSDTDALNDLYTNVIVNLISNILTIVGVFVAMLIVNVRLTLYVILVCPVVLTASIIFRKLSRKAHRDVRGKVSEMNAFLSENISGMKITQVFNQEEKKYNEFHNKNEELKRSSLREITVFAVFRPFIYILYLLTTMIVLWFGSKEAMVSGAISFSIIVIFYEYIERFFNPLQQLAEQFNVLQSAFASSERIFDILDTKPVIVDSSDAIELDKIEGNVEFKNVWFSYIPNEWILKDVSFKINKNDTVAFVGATGSGKTTILSLIVRNYDIQKGEILIDGIDIKKIKISSLRKHIGQMLQDVFLFSGTISSNIKMRDEDISDEEVREACEYVNADKMIDKLPDKYNDIVKERGNNFSSGQRQLISFARTVVHKPQIMILDEATANIDTETEKVIQNSLQKMFSIGTMLIVAHRLSTIQKANNIIVLQKGEIIEQGTHQELLKNKGHYYSLYKLQYQGLETE